MQFSLRGQDGEARLGQLTLSHGVVQTPIFMPCGTYGSVKAVTPEQLKDLGLSLIHI